MSGAGASVPHHIWRSLAPSNLCQPSGRATVACAASEQDSMRSGPIGSHGEIGAFPRRLTAEGSGEAKTCGYHRSAAVPSF
jgi:hypothetical protein